MQPTGMDLGRVGVWAFQFSTNPMDQARSWAAEVERLGYGAIWIPDAGVREPLVNSMALLAATERIVLATGVASIWARPAPTMASGHRSIESAYPGRFLLGLGVSHQPAVEGFFGTPYEKPYTAMVEYLDLMDRSPFFASAPDTEPQRALAALGPKMLRLSGERTAGAHTYNVVPGHTAEARELLGADPFLAVEHAVVLADDAEAARAAARGHLGMYLGLPNYTNNLLRHGFTADDFASGGSDRLVDALVAWGGPDEIAAAVRAHHDAGADHVCIQVLPTGGVTNPDVWAALAPVLIDAD